MPRFSLCMIVRDEEAFLAACLKSVRGLVDELVVVDTGSRDKTREIARSFGARVVEREWTDDFSAARNAALAAATGEWVLVLDADEELDLAAHDSATARARLERFTVEHAGAAGRVTVENRTGAGETSEVELARFFRLDRDARYTGRIHEHWTLGDGSTPPRADTGLRIVHHGYRPELVEQRSKLERNLRLLELDVQERPDDGYSWYQLGRTLQLAGAHDGALEALERALGLASDGEEWPVHALELGAESLRALGRSQQALELVESALPLAPERTDTLFLAALLALDCGDVERAEQGFRTCLERGPSRSGPERSTSAGSWAAAHNLAVICEHTERGPEAARLYRRALSACPGHAGSLAGLARLGSPLPSAPAIR